LIGEDSKKKGLDKLTSRQIEALIRETRSRKSKRP